MYVKKIYVKNFRLLKDTTISLNQNKTVFVGKNNTGKTTVMNVLDIVTNCVKRLKFEDYPISCRSNLYYQIEEYIKGNILLDDLIERIDLTQFTLEIDYNDRDMNDPLGELSNFIIDLDEHITYAIIKCSYDLSSNIDQVLQEIKLTYLDLIEEIEKEKEYAVLQQLVRKEFSKLFELKIYALNPNDRNDFQLKTYENLRGLFSYRKIMAERNLGESTEEPRLDPLGSLLSSLFTSEIAYAEESIQPAVLDLKRMINLTKYDLQKEISDYMDKIVESMLTFGYPSDEDLLLKAYTDLDIEGSIITGTQLTYSSHDNVEELPGAYNGLGYKNLIKISLVLQEYIRALKNESLKIPVLFIEEPEAHMHPQLQATFIEYVESYIESFELEHPIQTIITTHSSHMANTVPFSQIRYFKKKKDNVVCKNLDEFKLEISYYNDDSDTISFLQQYIKLNHCDLYFCDKAILVEGTTERLLIKDMIYKCYEMGLYEEERPSLQSQYYTIIEVGGAYAFKFFEFLNFIEVPTLVVTDIDFVNQNGKACTEVDAVRSSNGTINRWFRKKLSTNKTKTLSISEILENCKDEENLIDNNIRISFQEKENLSHPRSFEEAILNVNREKFGIAENLVETLFDSTKESKTDFALKMLFKKEFAGYIIPSYISKGLVWLSSQKSAFDNLVGE